MISDFIWDFGKLPFPTHLGKYFIKIGKIRAKIHEIGKIKAIFGLGMTPIYCLKNGQIKSLVIVATENILMKINSCKELAYRMDHSKPKLYSVSPHRLQPTRDDCTVLVQWLCECNAQQKLLDK